MKWHMGPSGKNVLSPDNTIIPLLLLKLAVNVHMFATCTLNLFRCQLLSCNTEMFC